MKDIQDKESYKRSKGEFYTPYVVSELAHTYIDSVLGINWREKFLVWDPCCSKANLTKNYQFNDLILSTLEESDIKFIKENGYNDGAVIARFDFLNDKIPQVIDEKLCDASESGKGIVFIMNPPFVDTGKG